MACVIDNSMEPSATPKQLFIDDTTTQSMELPMSNPNTPLAGPLVWSGSDFNDTSYTLQLTKSDIEEVDAALNSFKTQGLDGDEVSKHNFPLPGLSSRLKTCATTIHEGQGFFVIKGLDAKRYSVEDSVTVYLGIASYIADKRGLQDKKGNVLSHITNSKLWKVPVQQRHGIHSSQALPYHNDMGCDILALQVRHSAQRGGFTYLSSSWTAFNQLLTEEPEVAKTLLAPNWPVQITGRSPQHYLAPAITIHEGRLMASMDPNRFGPHPSSDRTDTPGLTIPQKHALERLSSAAYRSELRLELVGGDILFFNNWALLHRRDAYTDDEETSRHMVRLWLRNSEIGWPVPQSFMPPWLAAYGENSQVKQLYPLVPMPDYKVPKYSAGSAAFVIEDSDGSDDE